MSTVLFQIWRIFFFKDAIVIGFFLSVQNSIFIKAELFTQQREHLYYCFIYSQKPKEIYFETKVYGVIFKSMSKVKSH